jgi:hypothetical protein
MKIIFKRPYLTLAITILLAVITSIIINWDKVAQLTLK